MILINDFFYIVQQENSSGSINAKITINPAHAIFNGHFPAKPVVPGVCMLQIILEVTEKILSQRLKLITAESIKFLSVLEPAVNNEIEVGIKYTIEHGVILLTASLFSGPVIFFKLKAALTSA
ncbi:3-hydroxyacyl-ACP dehydratase [soil metagenome]